MVQETLTQLLEGPGKAAWCSDQNMVGVASLDLALQPSSVFLKLCPTQGHIISWNLIFLTWKMLTLGAG